MAPGERMDDELRGGDGRRPQVDLGVPGEVVGSAHEQVLDGCVRICEPQQRLLGDRRRPVDVLGRSGQS